MSGLLNPRPVIEQDWGLHFHHLNSLHEFWRLDRRLWGYNPFFMAGYPSNTIQDLSIKLFEFLALMLSALGLDLSLAFKWVVFMSMAAIPWILFFTARYLFEEGRPTQLAPSLAAFLGTAYWWNSLPREMFFYGMVGFPLSSYLSLLALALFYWIWRADRSFISAHALWVVVAVILLPLHFQTVLIAAPPAIALAISHGRLPKREALLWVGIGVIASLVLNSLWLIPAFTHRGDEVSSAIVAQLPLFSSPDPLTFLKDYFSRAGYWTFRPSA